MVGNRLSKWSGCRGVNRVIGRFRDRDEHGDKIRYENRNKGGDEETVGGGYVGVDEGWKICF